MTASIDTSATGALDDPAEAESLSRSEAPRRNSRRLVVGLVLLLAFFLLRFLVAEPVRTNGDSMEPTLRDGDTLVIDKLSYRFGDPTVGDIVVATAPDTGDAVVKRVVAVAGDSIEIYDGVLRRNGADVVEPYIDYDDMAGFFWGPAVVPAGHVFLLGDNRRDSVDSRTYGPVAVDAIDGRYLFSLWPL